MPSHLWISLPIWCGMLGFLSIGGYFMFRRFLKVLPKGDGRSDFDRECDCVQKTIHLWDDSGKKLLEELLTPVPKPFRSTARQTIAGKIGSLALKRKVKHIDRDLLIEGYILATPRRDLRWVLFALRRAGIEKEAYEHFLKR